MANIFFVADTHFGQASLLRYKRADGVTPVRSFGSVEEMDETMVDRWNATVRPSDHIYHLGDVTMRKQNLSIVRRLRGHKRIIPGNHDIFEWKHYREVGFEKLCGMRVLDGMIFTHIPIHPYSQRFTLNVHGHFHGNPSPPGRYFCVSVEQIDYTPVSLEEIKQRARALIETIGDLQPFA